MNQKWKLEFIKFKENFENNKNEEILMKKLNMLPISNKDQITNKYVSFRSPVMNEPER